MRNPMRNPLRAISRLASLSLLLLAGGELWAAEANRSFRVGAAVRVITPQPLPPLSGGFGPTAPVHTQQGELTARASSSMRCN